MTGCQLANLLLGEMGVVDVHVRRGGHDCFFPAQRIITLTGNTYHGHRAAHLARAAHEVAHVEQQSSGWPILALSKFIPFRLLIEWDANRRALRFLRSAGLPADKLALARAELTGGLRSYVAGFAWRGWLALGIVLFWWLLTAFRIWS